MSWPAHGSRSALAAAASGMLNPCRSPEWWGWLEDTVKAGARGYPCQEFRDLQGSEGALPEGGGPECRCSLFSENWLERRPQPVRALNLLVEGCDSTSAISAPLAKEKLPLNQSVLQDDWPRSSPLQLSKPVLWIHVLEQRSCTPRARDAPMPGALLLVGEGPFLGWPFLEPSA